MLNNLKLDSTSLRNALPIIAGSLVFIIIHFCLGLNSTQLIVSLSFLFIYGLLLFIGLHYYRKHEMELIITAINKIRTNSIKSAGEINLGMGLRKLEKEIKSMYQKMQQDISHLKKLEQVRTEFLGNVSHELRTPIFAIQGFIETLLDGAIDDKKVNRSFLQKANQHTLNLNSLLNDLIDISMIESGQMIMSFRYFNAYEFLEAIVHELQPYAEMKNLSLNLSELDKKLLLFGDKQRLKQVMTNLIMNAIKYTETGNIDVGIIEEVKTARIFVLDTGIGISDADKGRIFERFYRVDKDRSRSMGGTGLGLAIVKHIVEAHGSEVKLESRVGYGSQFSFSLKK